MVSVFDIFKIGIGPSSSHTMGPMVAANRFIARLERANKLAETHAVRCDLQGSLAFTGKGHATDRAVILGLLGELPAKIDPGAIDARLAQVAASGTLQLAGTHPIGFQAARDIVFDYETQPDVHPNAMRLTAFDVTGAELEARDYFSVGGGFIVTREDFVATEPAGGEMEHRGERYGFRSAQKLLELCAQHDLTIAEVVLANERSLRTAEEVDAGLDELWEAMNNCIERGISSEGILPGGLAVRRRAKALYARAICRDRTNLAYPHDNLERVNAFALAVNEENAAGGRVVTSPTNGAAGVIPAVLRYYVEQCPGAHRGGIHIFLLSATAFGAVIKYNASLSGAEVGCQGEVGSASAMAAAGLCAALGGSPEQIENAAEIALEHHLGMTCDPVAGLVQVPCIERNAMGAIKAINAASLALAGDGQHIVPFDTVVETMRQTGLDMQSKYKETSQGGLAINVAVVAC
ncbi:MAG: L-serine ammonia-lyase [Pseudomonadota bacterium]